MNAFMNEKDFDFCVNAIKMIKENNASYVKGDPSISNDGVEVYKNQDDKIMVKIQVEDKVKYGSPQHELDVVKDNIETLLKSLKDLRFIKSWYYNGVDGGGYHWEFK